MLLPVQGSIKSNEVSAADQEPPGGSNHARHAHADVAEDCGHVHGEEDEEEIELEDAQWMPGEVLDIYAGGAETAASLDSAAEMGLRGVVVLWHASWIEASVAAEEELARIAAAHPHIMCLNLAVDASSDNNAFALEQVCFVHVQNAANRARIGKNDCTQVLV